MVNPLAPKPKPAKAVLTSMERGVFDAVLAISAALDKGMIAGLLIAPSTGGTMAEIIFPPKEGAAEDEANPSKKIECDSCPAVIAMAGEIVHQMIVLDHQTSAAHGDYLNTVAGHRQRADRSSCCRARREGTDHGH